MRKKTTYVLCVRPGTDLEVGRVYRAVMGRLSDREAEAHGRVRVIDDSGEDYLHPQTSFVALELPPSVTRLLGRGRSVVTRSRPARRRRA